MAKFSKLEKILGGIILVGGLFAIIKSELINFIWDSESTALIISFAGAL